MSSAEFAALDFNDFARGGGETKLKRLAKVFQHAEPVAEAGAMAFVHDDEVEEIRLEMLEELFAVEFFVEVLVVGEENLPDAMLVLLNKCFVNEDARRSRKGAERAVSLILQVVTVSKEKDAIITQDVSSNQFPNELKNGESLARASGHQQQHARNAQREVEHRLVDRHLLIRANLLSRDLVNVPRLVESGLPACPINRVAKPVENVAWCGWRG